MKLALKKAANHTSAVWRNRCIDWDWNGWDDPFAYDGDEDWLLDYQEDKPAPLVEIELLAMAKPAKARRRREFAPRYRHTVGLPSFTGVAPPPHSKPQPASDFSDIDDVSLLDFEETWDDFGVDHLSVEPSGDQTSDTSGEWDRCSNI